MSHDHDSHNQEHHRAKHAADVIQDSTRLLPHELDALKETNLVAEHTVDSLYFLLGKVEVLNGKLHRQLVEWHTQFPQKPSLQDSDSFWRELKELRATKEQLQFLLDAIRAHEERINTLGTQLRRTQESIDAVEHYFDGYLNRVNKG